MADLTDPASELSAVLGLLTNPANEQTWQYLSNQFGVDHNSIEFSLIIAEIRKRALLISRIVNESDCDDSVKSLYNEFISLPITAFHVQNLNQSWSNMATHYVNANSVRNIIATVPVVKRKVQYIRYTDDELEDISESIALLVEKIRSEIVIEFFYRESIILNLLEIKFRIDNFRWFGWDCTADLIRRLLEQYAIVRSSHTENLPHAGAMLNLLNDGLAHLLDRLKLHDDRLELLKKLFGYYKDIAAVSLPSYILQLPFIPNQ